MSPRDPAPIPDTYLPNRLAPLLVKLGAADRRRLEQLLPLFHQGRARLSECFRAVFPGSANDKAQTNFRKFRQKVNAAGATVGLVFAVDTNLQASPDGRFCWFEGEDTTEREFLDLAEQATADIARPLAAEQLISPRAVPASGESLAANRRPVKIFVSFSSTHLSRKNEPEEELSESHNSFPRSRKRLLIRE
jgi:hypothetical protein